MHPEALASSFEQSKKLKELGAPQDGFFQWCEVELQGRKSRELCSQDRLQYYKEKGIVYTVLCSAFTFTEARVQFPFSITHPDHPGKNYHLSIVPHESGRLDVIYFTADRSPLLKQTEEVKDADAATEMLIYLRKEGIVKPDNQL